MRRSESRFPVQSVIFMAQKLSSAIRSSVFFRGSIGANRHALETDAGRVRFFLGALLRLPGGQGAKEKLADVSENGGTAGSDAVFGHKGQELGEEGVDFFRGFEAAETAGEGGDVRGVLRA